MLTDFNHSFTVAFSDELHKKLKYLASDLLSLDLFAYISGKSSPPFPQNWPPLGLPTSKPATVMVWNQAWRLVSCKRGVLMSEWVMMLSWLSSADRPSVELERFHGSTTRSWLISTARRHAAIALTAQWTYMHKGAITSKIKHAIKHTTNPARLAQLYCCTTVAAYISILF